MPLLANGLGATVRSMVKSTGRKTSLQQSKLAFLLQEESCKGTVRAALILRYGRARAPVQFQQCQGMIPPKSCPLSHR